MYIVVIAWMYVVLMMSVAEATNSSGSVLGAVITFVLYGLLPISIVVYVMGTGARRKARQAAEAAEAAIVPAAITRSTVPSTAPSPAPSPETSTTHSIAPRLDPDGSGHAAGAAVAAERKKA